MNRSSVDRQRDMSQRVTLSGHMIASRCMHVMARRDQDSQQESRSTLKYTSRMRLSFHKMNVPNCMGNRHSFEQFQVEKFVDGHSTWQRIY